MQTQTHHVALIVVDVQNGFTPGEFGRCKSRSNYSDY